jgi:hypothetical protein
MAILNQSIDQLKERADQTDLEKLKFEKRMASRLNGLFIQIGRDFQTIYATTGQMQNINLYADEMNAIIKRSYREVSAFFRDDLKREIEREALEADTETEREYYTALLGLRAEIEPDLISAILAAILLRAPAQSRFILETTGKVIRKNVNNVISDAALEGVVLTNEQVASKSRVLINRENKNRSGSISSTEVQWSTENATFTEADLFDDKLREEGVTDPSGQAVFPEKTWITMGDNRVRKEKLGGHQAANGQRRRLKEPFIVQGQMLRHPGDTSLGATLDNIIECRCVSVVN